MATSVLRGSRARTRHARSPGVPAVRRSGDRARRRLGLPAVAPRHGAGRLRRSRVRRRRLGPAARALPLAAARLRRAGLHQRRLSVPGRPAARARREPDGRLPRAVPGPGGLGRHGRGAALRGRRLVPARVAERNGAGRLHGQPAAGRVRRRAAAPAGRGERAGRPRAPVVGRVLPRGPGHVVAVGDLPRRHAARPSGRRDRRRLRARGLRPRDRRRDAARRHRCARARHGARARDRRRGR